MNVVTRLALIGAALFSLATPLFAPAHNGHALHRHKRIVQELEPHRRAEKGALLGHVFMYDPGVRAEPSRVASLVEYHF